MWVVVVGSLEGGLVTKSKRKGKNENLGYKQPETFFHREIELSGESNCERTDPPNSNSVARGTAKEGISFYTAPRHPLTAPTALRHAHRTMDLRAHCFERLQTKQGKGRGGQLLLSLLYLCLACEQTYTKSLQRAMMRTKQ